MGFPNAKLPVTVLVALLCIFAAVNYWSDKRLEKRLEKMVTSQHRQSTAEPGKMKIHGHKALEGTNSEMKATPAQKFTSANAHTGEELNLTAIAAGMKADFDAKLNAQKTDFDAKLAAQKGELEGKTNSSDFDAKLNAQKADFDAKLAAQKAEVEGKTNSLSDLLKRKAAISALSTQAPGDSFIVQHTLKLLEELPFEAANAKVAACEPAPGTTCDWTPCWAHSSGKCLPNPFVRPLPSSSSPDRVCGTKKMFWFIAQMDTSRFRELLALASVRSARKNAPSLIPIVVTTAQLQIPESLRAAVEDEMPRGLIWRLNQTWTCPWLPTSCVGDPQHQTMVAAAFARVGVPAYMKDILADGNFKAEIAAGNISATSVLYTDTDVMFQPGFNPCDLPAQNYQVAYGPQDRTNDGAVNTGVMAMNLNAFTNEFAEGMMWWAVNSKLMYEKFFKEALDQGMLNHWYWNVNPGQAARLGPEWNWKGYWGWSNGTSSPPSPQIKVFHWHGPVKPGIGWSHHAAVGKLEKWVSGETGKITQDDLQAHFLNLSKSADGCKLYIQAFKNFTQLVRDVGDS